MDDTVSARRVEVEGVVQGVGYREFCRRCALRLHISGWVRNRRDGAVEAVIVGAAADVEAMLAKMREGPPGAEVRNLRITAPDAAGAQEGDFVVRATV